MQCTALATSTKTGRRCVHPAVEGSDRCKLHFDIRHTRAHHMPRFYREVLRGVVAQNVNRILDETPAFQHLDCSEEIAIARTMGADLVALYVLAKESGNAELISSTAVQGMSVLQDIVKVVEQGARVEHLQSQIRGPLLHSLETVIQRLTIAAYRAFGDDHRVKDMVEMLRDELRAEISTAGAEQSGTSLLPSGEELQAQVLQMDDTVPNTTE